MAPRNSRRRPELVPAGVISEHADSWSVHGEVEQPDVPDRSYAKILRRAEDVFQGEVLHHRPRRSSRSA